MTRIKVFSYGSNMLVNQITQRAKSTIIECIGGIIGYKLMFHKISKDGSGKASVYKTDDLNDTVWGIIISINPNDKKKLDKFEGLGYGYKEETIPVYTSLGKISTITYVATNDRIDNNLKPYDWYYQYIIEGAKQNNLPSEYIKSLENVEYIIDSQTDRRNEKLSLL